MNQTNQKWSMEKNDTSHPLEIWGGLECTINRVEDVFRDQFTYTGHYLRNDDIEKIAALGIKKLRYPILWERHTGPDASLHWKWTEQQLNKMIELGIEPIIGFLHHGSGPSFTNLLDPDFPEKLACFAKEVIYRFPFLRTFNPVNEPLTTARFSGQYGWWYPHKKDQRSFVRMLLNQCKGIVRCMQEIRVIIPNAKLIQSEDLSKVYSTPPLAYQASFENARRWFSLDLLTGALSNDSPYYGYFKRLDITDEELCFFSENPTPPHIIGFNYYITSERFLDHEIEKYPHIRPGGNGQDHYVDLEAIRIPMEEPMGLTVLMKEAWERYHLPMALTEVHMGCTREEQLRWLKDVWDDCVLLKNMGVDVRALTVWSMLGAYDWNSLLTKEQYHYETGVFDVSSGSLRPTALAHAVKELTSKGGIHHPLVNQLGWWKREIRFHKDDLENWREMFRQADHPLLIIGKNGTLAKAFSRITERRGIPSISFSRSDINILDRKEIAGIISQYNPWAVINCAGYVDVDQAEIEKDLCMQLNVIGAENLAIFCCEYNIPFLTFSSDLVFGGNKQTPYTESDAVNPLNVYGLSKVLAEERVLKAYKNSLIIRSSAFFGPWDPYNFVYKTVQSISTHQVVELPEDVIVSPTYVPDLVNASLDLLIDQERGIWHLTNAGHISWADFAAEVADHTVYGNKHLVRRKLEELDWLAVRPNYSAMKTEKGILLPKLAHALERYFKEAEAV